MCGIFCILTSDVEHTHLQNIYEKCEENIKRRGPDYFNTISTICKGWKCKLASSVLWLQGPEIRKQPVETEKSIFLFNGDVFDGDLVSCDQRRKYGDTKPLLDAIESSYVTKAFLKTHGPCAFIFIDKIHSKLYFGRDTYGRRSLLIGRNENTILLTSVATKEIPFQTIELPALGIFCIDLNKKDFNNLILFPWKNKNQFFLEKLNEIEKFLHSSIICDITKENDLNVKINVPKEVTVENITNLKPDDTFSFLLLDAKWKQNVDNLKKLLENAVKKRIDNQPPFCSKCIKSKISCSHAILGVLFSGGIDCAVLALLADKFIDPKRPIDLLNVAFEHTNGYEVPDRITARQTFQELLQLRPDRKWKLLEINVTQNTLCEERSKKISHLIYPLQSILDESLGCALWFAARGETESYTSTCRVLLVGMGADELFGGYTRHRAAFKRGEWKELAKELDSDWKNISHRNLARDDRVVSDHGRQLRTPYLDESVVEFVRNLDTWEKCYPSEKVIQGLGDKLLLRTLAYTLGLEKAATIKKRALQFGSRIANRKENAHDISPRL